MSINYYKKNLIIPGNFTFFDNSFYMSIVKMYK